MDEADIAGPRLLLTQPQAHALRGVPVLPPAQGVPEPPKEGEA